MRENRKERERERECKRENERQNHWLCDRKGNEEKKGISMFIDILT